MTGSWKVELQWHWATRSHINLLESQAYLSLLRLLIREGGDLRFSALLDSRVAKGSHAKGRSSSKALMPSLRKSAALQICGGLYGFRTNSAEYGRRPNKGCRSQRKLWFLMHLPSSAQCGPKASCLASITAHCWMDQTCFAPWISACERCLCVWPFGSVRITSSLSMWILLGMVPLCHCFRFVLDPHCHCYPSHSWNFFVLPLWPSHASDR